MSDISLLREQANAAIVAGDHTAAAGFLRLLADLSVVDTAEHVDVVLELAHAEAASGDVAAAVSTLAAAAVDLRERRERQPLARVLIFLACALADGGDPVQASAALEEADRLVDADDWYSTLRLRWARARLAGALGDHDQALGDIGAVIEILERSDFGEQLGRAHILASTPCLGAGLLNSAGSHLVAARSKIPVPMRAEDEAVMLSNEARVAVARGYGSDGLMLAYRALRLVVGRSPAEESRAWWAIAEALEATGKPHADSAYGRALTLAGSEDRFSLQIVESWLHAMQFRCGELTVRHSSGEVAMLRRELRELRQTASSLRAALERVREEVLGDPESPSPDRRSRRAALRLLP
jgi:tetratricopeptide (TPR) repeat protein